MKQTSVEMKLIGRFALYVRGIEVDVPRQSQRLLAHLAVCGGCIDRERLAAALWPEAPTARSQANVRTAVWRTRSIERSLLSNQHQSRVVLASDIVVDLFRIEELGRRLFAGDTRAVAEVQTFNLPAELLDGWYEDWVLIERARLSQIHARMLEELVRQLTCRGELHRALDIAMRLAVQEPLRESVRRALLLILCVEGNHGEAVEHLREFNEYLLREVGGESSIDLAALRAEALALQVRQG